MPLCVPASCSCPSSCLWALTDVDLSRSSLPPPPPPPPVQSDAYRESRIKLGGLTEHLLQSMRSGRRIMFVACGTSYHATLAARCAAPPLPTPCT